MSDIDVKNSILASVKKQLGGAIDPFEESPFDDDIIMNINSVFGILQQLGVGPENGFAISDSSSLWSDFTDDLTIQNMVKPYMFAKVKLGFDISSTPSSVIEVLKNNVAEFEWRMNVHVDPGKEKT